MRATRPTQPPDNAASRRKFLLKAGVLGGLALAAGGGLIIGLRRVLPAITPKESRRVRVVALKALPEGKAVLKTIAGVSFALVHDDGVVRAFSALCTHLGCRIQWQSDERRFFCPCHLGYFDADGKVISGPPPRPLDEYDAAIDGDNVYVILPEPTE